LINIASYRIYSKPAKTRDIMPYRAPSDEYQFLFDHVVRLSQVTETEKFGEATPDLTSQ